MKLSPNYLKSCLCLNVLANSPKNAAEIYEAAEGHVLVGVLSKNYETDDAAIEDMKKYAEVTKNALSIGLGAGDPKQSAMVARLSGILKPQHANQVFTGIGATRALLREDETVVNCLVNPTGKLGLVNIATGPLSSKAAEPAEVTIETAIALIKDMGGSSIKFFNMHGLVHLEEFRVVAQACAAEDFYLEPTGGIDLDNFEIILQTAVDAGVKKIIPHVYSSIVDKTTGDTKIEAIRTLLALMKKALE
ncbi:MAG: KDGP aldolase family protein [Streptococcaceae bacterium]|jgi:uncharacterized protein (TIGR03581 family)|nr:KDGP aldolase family protein [Streptococcaceae bacterium]